MRRFVLGEFPTPEALVSATRVLRERGNTSLDTHTPYPVHGTSEALGLRKSRVPALVLAAGLSGAALGYLLQWYPNAVDFPINVGNRPPHSPLAFLPITFELGVLFAAFAAFLGTLGLSKLPLPYHPVFESDGFRRASVDTFWLSVEVGPSGDATALAAEVKALGALTVDVVEEAER